MHLVRSKGPGGSERSAKSDRPPGPEEHALRLEGLGLACAGSSRRVMDLPNQEDAEWTTIATAPDQLTAEMWQQLMWQEGIPAILDPHDAISFMGVASTPVRLKAPADLAVKAQEVLAGVQGAADWIEPGRNGDAED